MTLEYSWFKYFKLPNLLTFLAGLEESVDLKLKKQKDS